MIYSLSIQRATQISKTFFIWKGKETGKEKTKQKKTTTWAVRTYFVFKSIWQGWFKENLLKQCNKGTATKLQFPPTVSNADKWAA